MKMKKVWKKIAAAGMALLMAGCSKTPKEEIICGGNTKDNDPNAAKVIESADITEFSVAFFLAERCTEDDDHRFDFQIKPDKNGVLTAYENHAGISSAADETLLNALQEVIAKNNLAAMNGIYDITSGLPPEYQPRKLKVDYASGETLRYTVDNDPYETWAVEICDIFADWFHTKGIVWNIVGMAE